MKKLFFVILHFLVEDETIACITSILTTQSKSDFEIIVVDNGSYNKSGDRLKHKYANDDRVKVILSKDNLGFAKGNNLGFMDAKRRGADFIYMINNDTFIQQKNCLGLIEEAFKKYQFHILGPDIILSKNGKHQNPAKPTLQDAANLNKMIFHHRALLALSYLNLDIVLPRFKKRIFDRNKNRNISVDKISHEHSAEGVKLHGSALVFSKLFIDAYDGLYPHTFMYSEEAILYYIAKRDGLKTLYFPELKIFHDEDKATEEMVGSHVKKRRFYYKNYVHSGRELYKMMLNDQSNG